MHFVKPADYARPPQPPHRQQIAPVSYPLHVACAISNPERYVARYKHYHYFRKHMAESGAVLYTAELALGDRHHEVTSHDDPLDLQFRSTSELWHKENLINLCVSRFPEDWRYGAYCDADFLMTRPDWVPEVVHQLQHYPWVQMFSTYEDLGPDYSPSPAKTSFAKLFASGVTPDGYYGGAFPASTGGAWAFRREAFDAVGGLLDTCILGSADWHMAYALAGMKDPHAERAPSAYKRSIAVWADRAASARGHVGFVRNHAMHFWHGRKSERGYGWRDGVLVKYDYDPYEDVMKDWQGVVAWRGNKPALEEEVRQYFRSRNEDVNTVA